MISRGIGSMFGALACAAAALVASESGAVAVAGQAASHQSSDDGWLTVDAGELHTCGIRDDHSLWCWGTNSYGGLGQGQGCPQQCESPVQVGTDTDWKRVSAGYLYTCGIRFDGTLWCWGANSGGTLGLGDRTDRSLPTQVGDDTDWSQINTAFFHTCGIREDRSLWCWGVNYHGQLGQGDTSTRLVPTRVGSARWTHVEAGDESSCAIRADHSLWCWGGNTHGQVGVGDTTDRLTPTRVAGGTVWTTVAVASEEGEHTCGIQVDHTLWCWGWGHFGQLGLGYPASRYVPTQVQAGTFWTGVAAGGAHTCATGIDGSAWCWGRGTKGQLGLGRRTGAQDLPRRVGSHTDWGHITVGLEHTCALRGSQSLWCWGYNDEGQLGLGDRTDRYRPTRL